MSLFWLLAVLSVWVGGIGSGPAGRSARGESLGAPWPDGGDSGDALRAAIAVTVTGQQLNTGRHL